MAEWLRQLTPTQEVVSSNPARSSGNMSSSLKRQKAYPCTWWERERIQYRIGLRPGQQGPRQVLRQLLSKSGIQNPDSTAEQPGQRNVKLREEQPQKKKWTVTENKEVMMCYFEADPSQRGYRKRMHNIWLSKHPDSTISEQRLADQSNVIMRRNLLTSVETEEIQRGLSTQACHTESSTPEQSMSNQPDLTPIEEIPLQQHSLNPRQMALKSRLIAQLKQEHRIRLPTLKTHAATKTSHR